MGIYIFLGAPGAGKGTMAAMLAEKEKLDHISTGDILRREMKNQTDLGSTAKNYVDTGKLVPDDVVTAIVAGQLGQNPQGAILDGFPRTIRQAELLEQKLAERNLELAAAVFFEVERDILLQRLTGRRVCRECGAVYHVENMPPKVAGKCDKCGGALYQRPDDTVATVEQRLEVYEKETAPLIDYYGQRNQLIRVSGSADRDTNFRILCDALPGVN